MKRTKTDPFAANESDAVRRAATRERRDDRHAVENAKMLAGILRSYGKCAHREGVNVCDREAGHAGAHRWA